MEPDKQMAWMEENLAILVSRASKMGVGAYIIYGQLLATAAGVGAKLDEEKKEQIHREIETAKDAEVPEVFEND